METSPTKRGVAVAGGGATKAQVALFKIIAVISTVRPPLNLDLNSEPDDDVSISKIDLSLRVAAAAASSSSTEVISTAESVMKTTITSETPVKNVDQEVEVEVEETPGGYLDVLLEAIDEVEEEGKNNRKRRAEEEAVVRSKRGRNQCLPLRFRDSVLEPWAKLPAAHRH